MRLPARTRIGRRQAADAILRGLDPVDAPEADLVAIKAWARLLLLPSRPGHRAPLLAELEQLEAMAFRRGDEVGWGLGWEWDAFNDGTVNPADTIYAFQTGLIGLMLLDAGAVLGEERYTALAHRAAVTLLDRAYTRRPDDVPTVWFSDQPADQLPHLHKHDVNALGLGLFTGVGADRDRWSGAERERMLDFLLAEQGKDLDPAPGNATNWRFGASRELPPGSILDRPNDLIHNCLILLGLQATGDPRAAAAVTAACADIVRHQFDRRGRPAEGVFTRGVRGWGPAAALFVLARQPGFEKATGRIGAALARSIDADGRSSLVPPDEPRALAWYALGLAASAVAQATPRRAASA